MCVDVLDLDPELWSFEESGIVSFCKDVESLFRWERSVCAQFSDSSALVDLSLVEYSSVSELESAALLNI